MSSVNVLGECTRSVDCTQWPGPTGPTINSRSASEPRERRHRSVQKRMAAPEGAQDRRPVCAPSVRLAVGAVLPPCLTEGSRRRLPNACLPMVSLGEQWKGAGCRWETAGEAGRRTAIRSRASPSPKTRALQTGLARETAPTRSDSTRSAPLVPRGGGRSG